MFNRKLFPTFIDKDSIDEAPSSPAVFPLPRLHGQPPVLLLFDVAELSIGVAYEKHHVPGGPLVRAVTRESTLYCIPRPTPVLAVSDGEVIGTRKHGNCNYRVVIDHGSGWLTVYSGLERLFVPSGEPARGSPFRVTTGDPIGYLAATRAGPLRPLYFELWRSHGLDDHEQLDPIRYMRRWHQTAWSSEPLRRAWPAEVPKG